MFAGMTSGACWLCILWYQAGGCDAICRALAGLIAHVQRVARSSDKRPVRLSTESAARR